MPPDLSHWRALIVQLGPYAPALNGWHHGTYWLTGTPAPLIAAHLRIGFGLLPRKTETPLSPTRAATEDDTHGDDTPTVKPE